MFPSDDWVCIDGSIGGGSVLRVGVPLAIARNLPIEITNIRQHRRSKGLRVQHLTGLQLLCQLTGSILEGGMIGSSNIRIIPNQIPIPSHQHPMIQMPTSAAVSLIIQTLSNYVFASNKAIGFDFIGGGTHVNWSPNFDILMGVNKPLFEIFGIQLHIQLMKPGFYPSGGAMGRVYIEPTNNRSIDQIILESSEFQGIDLISHASNDQRSDRVAERQIAGFKGIIPVLNKEIIGYADASSSGSACTSIIRYSNNIVKGVARINQPGLRPEDVGRRTAKATLKEMKLKTAVDEQLADQLIVPLVFMPTGSSYTFERIFPHVKTNFEVVNTLLDNPLEIKKTNDHFIMIRK